VVVNASIYFMRPNSMQKRPSDISSGENLIRSFLPEGSILRDYQQIPGKKNEYLVIYVEKGYEFNSWEISCPGEILGDSIIGDYHLVLIQDSKLINDIPIPPAYSGDHKLELTYKNYSDGWVNYESKHKEIIKLLNLKDLTGDKSSYEFLLTTTAGGCGFYDGLVGGYDPEKNLATLYSGWIPRFSPDENGEFIFLFECGDHGNLTRTEKEYHFNKDLNTYEVVKDTETPCNYN
jgi:hypothetical protein